MMKRVMLVCVGALAAVFCVQDLAHAELAIVSHSAVIDTPTRRVTFSVTFNENVDFVTKDAQGRQADSFQFYIDIHNGQPGPTYNRDYGNLDTIASIRELTPSWTFPIRIAGPMSYDPTSGGWGAVRGWSTLNVVGRKATFVADLDVIGANLPGTVLPNGCFGYQLIACEYGAIRGQALDGVSTSVPEPGTVVLLGLGGVVVRRRRHLERIA
jgi:hypothetical protein